MVKKEHGQLCLFLLEFLYMNSVAGLQLFERGIRPLKISFNKKGALT